jgi:hypothetical protein
MPLDPTNPSLIFIRALLGESPTPDQLASLDSGWAELVQAAQHATPVNRRAALILAKSGQADTDHLLEVLRGQPTSEQQPWPDPTPFGPPRLPEFPVSMLPDWLTIYVRSESRATQTPVDLTAMLALAVLSTALAGPIVLNPWGTGSSPSTSSPSSSCPQATARAPSSTASSSPCTSSRPRPPDRPPPCSPSPADASTPPSKPSSEPRTPLPSPPRRPTPRRPPRSRRASPRRARRP